MNKRTKPTLSEAVMPSPQRIAEIEAFDNAWANLRGKPNRAQLIQQMIDSGTLMAFGKTRRKPQTFWMQWQDEIAIISMLAIAVLIILVIR
jgi:hypothetical protein